LNYSENFNFPAGHYFAQDQLDLPHAQNPAFIPAVNFGAHQDLIRMEWNRAGERRA